MFCHDAVNNQLVQLKYNDSGRDKRIQPRIGQWNLMNARMVNGGKVDHWACLNFSQRNTPDVAQYFFKQLVGMCNSKGLGTSRPTHYHVLYDENNFTADGLQMLLTIFVIYIRGAPDLCL